ncbi:MAG: hypothetical protein EAY75_11980 [Bacteroidetes bacterium]|nr:MAG: hypothetical protein EAY75_11980 [Bacteroidota bacterium]
MNIYNQPIELIIEQKVFSGKSKQEGGGVAKRLEAAGIEVDDVLKNAARLPVQLGKPLGKNMGGATTYVRTKVLDAVMNPWDMAHLSAKALGSSLKFVEPDMLTSFVADSNMDVPFKKGMQKGKKADGDSFDPDWQPKRNAVWHLGNDFSQLKAAREAVANLPHTIRIAHLDTGYNKTHKLLPDTAKTNVLQRSFIAGETDNDAHDRYVNGLGRMPGHGTGTLALLAGKSVKLATDDGEFNDFLGGAPFAEVVCLRISPTVILLKTSAFAEALNYATALTQGGTPIHVLSMSMGGAPSRAWTAAVNRAYEAGITMVTAAGNNYNGAPTRHVIYPARYDRVIAACGVTHDLRPYFSSKLGEMAGCFGPERHMNAALAAFTPNTPWAYGNAGGVDFAGAGTSSATPQIAAAAAIYYRKNFEVLNALEPWKRVEAIRYALFKSASKKGKPMGTYRNDFGNGILQAFDALKVGVNSNRAKTPPDETPWFPILNTLFKTRPGVAQAPKMEMFNTELAQLVFYHPELRALINNDERPYERVSQKKWRAFSAAVVEHHASSNTLKNYLIANWHAGKPK